METNIDIIPLFPIPLGKILLPNSLSPIINYIDSHELVESYDVKNFGRRTKNTYILNDPPCLDLSNFILKTVLEFGQKVLNYSYTEYKFSQSWVSHKHPGESHASHQHPNSLISGVIYYGNWDDSLPNIYFTNEGTLKNSLRPKYQNPQDTEFSPYAIPYYELNTSPGMMILFPSTLPHGVPKNTSQQIRKSLAFNIVPAEGFGDEEDLTQLKFN